MADIQLIFDTAPDSSAERQGNSAVYVTRGGIAVGLPTDTTVMQPEDVLIAILAAPGMPAMGDPHPTVPSAKLTRVQVLGQNSQAARFRLIYEPFGGTASALIIDVGSSLSTYATNFMPGTRQPFALSYEAPDASTESIPTDYPIINLLRPVRRISVTQLQLGTLDVNDAASFSKYVGQANLGRWMDEDEAHWIIAEASAQISKYAGYYSRRLSAIDNQGDAWFYLAILRSQITGKYAGDAEAIQTTTDSLKALPYEAKRVLDGNGVLRVDPYDLTDFNVLFGFGAAASSTDSPFNNADSPFNDAGQLGA